jgi:hypothetical protein
VTPAGDPFDDALGAIANPQHVVRVVEVASHAQSGGRLELPREVADYIPEARSRFHGQPEPFVKNRFRLWPN